MHISHGRPSSLAGHTIVSLLSSLLLCACQVAGGTPQEMALRERVGGSLVRAGQNRQEIEAFLAGREGEERTAAEFLVANMPSVDLVSLSEEDLTTNLVTAFRAREELRWGRSVPPNVFLHYVLPHRVTQEATSRWRARFYRELQPVLAECASMVDAALAVNRWCGQRVGFKQTEFRDQNAIATLKAGYGRCEEMMIFCIDAMRAAGIPARPCSTPWWATNDNNHAWVEVWADGDWYYLGGCEPGDGLDQAWFTGPARRAAMVVSTMYGRPDGFETDDRVYRVNGNTSYINSTAVYAMTGELDVVVTDGEGLPVPDCPVAVSVFNFGGLRSLTQRRTDGEGRASILVGMGEFFVSAGNGEAGRAHEVVASVPEGITVVALVLTPGQAPAERFWLRFPTTAEAARLAALRPKGNTVTLPTVRPELAAYARPQAHDGSESPGVDLLLTDMGEERSARARLILADSLDNWSNLVAALAALDVGDRVWGVEFLDRTTHLDRLELDVETIEDHVRMAVARRRPDVDEVLWLDHVLRAGTDMEHLGPWRRELEHAWSDCDDPDAVEVARRVHGRLAAEIGRGSRGRLGPLMNPGQVWRCGAGTDRETVILGVGVLRALGIPARRQAHEEWVEFNTGEAWGRFDPRDADAFVLPETGGDEGPVRAGVAGAATSGSIGLVLRRDGDVDTGFHGWDVARFSGGAWSPLRNVAVAVEGTAQVATVPAGEYLVTAGVRNGNGDAWVHTSLVEVSPGGRTTIEWDLDPPPGAGVFGLPMVRPWRGMRETELVDLAGRTWRLGGDEKAQPLLLVLFTLDNEPSLRMLPLFNGLVPDLEEAGVESLGVLLPSAAGVELPAELGSLALPVARGSVDLGRELGLRRTEAGRFDPMPSVLLLGADGAPILWTEGYDLSVDVLIREALERLGSGSKGG